MRHQLSLETPDGQLVGVVADFVRLSYARSLNEIGKMELWLPPGYRAEQFPPDSRWRIARSVGGGPFVYQLQTFWLTRMWERTLLPGGDWETYILAHDLLDLTERRIVAYTRDTPYADKMIPDPDQIGTGTGVEIDGSDYEDNLIKAFFRENLGTLALNMFTGVTPDPARDLSDLIIIDPDVSAGGYIAAEKQASFQTLFSLAQDLCEHSSLYGVDLYFDFEVDDQNQIWFRTYPRQRGIDRRQGYGPVPAVFSPELGNLENVVISLDYRDDVTAAYVGGEGQGVDRVIVLIEDDDRIARSPFGRIERFIDGRDWASETVLIQDGEAELNRGTARRKLTADVVDTSDSLYGLHYGYGDRVTAVADGVVFDCMISAVQIEVEGDTEVKQIKLEGTEITEAQEEFTSFSTSFDTSFSF